MLNINHSVLLKMYPLFHNLYAEYLHVNFVQTQYITQIS